MLIDWFTVSAQVVNFLILVWLMRRFLYRPILNAIDAREKLIAKELADASAKMADAQAEQDEFRLKNEEFDKHQAAMLNKSRVDALAERTRLLGEATQAADDLTSKRRESLAREAHSLNQALKVRTQREVFAVARKTLKDLASASLEEKICEAFLLRLKNLDAKAKDELVKPSAAVSCSAILRSAFVLAPAQRAAMQKALDEAFSANVDIQFEAMPELVGGIELTANGQKLAWSISEYLSSMENGVAELLKENPTAGGDPQPDPTGKPRPATLSTPEGKTKPLPRVSAVAVSR